VSVVLHPENPHVPTCHANFRYLEHGDKAWFGGGADLTPYYFHADDEEHFHAVWRAVCERHPDVADYPRFRDACDRYFFLPHRGERRGVGGIFFDYLFVEDRADALLAFVHDAGNAFLDAYVPIVRRRRATAATKDQRTWQERRRGRYVEFNLLYDRGTIFGLKTGGRTESILMSLPPRVRWDYAADPAPGTPEAALLTELRRPPPPD
jgi:coproporphyrinogen III oxidase